MGANLGHIRFKKYLSTLPQQTGVGERLRCCAFLGHFVQHPVPRAFPSPFLIESYSVVSVASPQQDLSTSLISALLLLGKHTIANHPPGVWIPLLKYLFLAPETRNYLNKTFTLVREHNNTEFWQTLSRTWKEFANQDAQGFIQRLIHSCSRLPHFLLFIDSLSDAQLSCILSLAALSYSFDFK